MQCDGHIVLEFDVTNQLPLKVPSPDSPPLSKRSLQALYRLWKKHGPEERHVIEQVIDLADCNEQWHEVMVGKPSRKKKQAAVRPMDEWTQPDLLEDE